MLGYPFLCTFRKHQAVTLPHPPEVFAKVSQYNDVTSISSPYQSPISILIDLIDQSPSKFSSLLPHGFCKLRVNGFHSSLGIRPHPIRPRISSSE